jgi:hypothetical protein
VIDPATDEAITGVEITAVDLFADGTVAVRSDAFGDFWIRGLEKDRKYRVEIRKDGYAVVREVVTTDGDQDLGTVALVRKA